MRAKETIAVIGTVFVDIKGFADAHYDPAGRNVGKIKLVHGGVGRNVAEDVARLGGGVLFVSSADDDMLGHGVVNRLSHSKIDTRYVRFAPSAGMGLWMVINDAAGRQVGAISQMPDVKHIERIIDEHGDAIVREADHIVLEIDLNEQISRRVLDLAWIYGKQVYALPGNMEVLLRNVELLKKVSCFICNDIEAGRLFHMETAGKDPEDMQRLVRRGVKELELPSMVITLGEKGCVFCDARKGAPEDGWEPAIATDVIDPSGAGDAFFSGTTLALTRGLPMRKAVKAGTQAAHRVLRSTESTVPAAKAVE